MTFPFIIGASQQKRSLRPLYMKWRTTTTNETVTLPLPNVVGVNYNFIIDWGDGAVSQITAYNDSDRIHTYATVGDHISRISGTCEGWSFNNGGDKAKLIEVYGGEDHVFKYIAAGFYGCSNLVKFDCPDLNISSITSLTYSFRNCTSLTTLNLVNWDTTNVTDLRGTFYGVNKITSLNLTNWVTSNVLYMGGGGMYENGTFGGMTALTSFDFTNWDTSKVQNFLCTFINDTSLTTVTGADNLVTSACTTIQSLFQGCRKLTTVSTTNWNTSNVLMYAGTFYDCREINNVDVSVFTINTTSSVNMDSTFMNCYTLSSLNLTGWNTSKVITFNRTFYNCLKLASISNTTNLVTSACISLNATFYQCLELTSLDTSGWDTSNVIYMGGNTWENGTFALCKKLQSLDASSWDTSKVNSFSCTFLYCQALTTITGMSNLVQSACTGMNSMFANCWELLSIDMTNWNTINVTNMAGCFSACKKITSLDFNGLNTAKVSSFYECFSFCNLLQSISNATNLITSACTSMQGMLRESPQLATIDTSGWDTSNIITLYSFALNCTSLNPLDVSGWNVSKVTTTQDAFRSCSSLTTINISGWNLTNVTNTAFMFAYCVGLTSLTLPASLPRVDTHFAAGCSGITVYNIYRATAPTVSGAPFGNYAKPLHVPVSNSGYNVAPWTNTAIFSSIINDL